MHGGKSTGPRTGAGLERSQRARWKHGAYSREARASLANANRHWRELWTLLVKPGPRELLPDEKELQTLEEQGTRWKEFVDSSAARECPGEEV
jgi:hypothetical protein